MDSEHLQPWQARKLCEAIRPSLRYLTKLRARKEQTGFPTDDKLFRFVGKTQNRTQDLHYLSCESGVGRRE